MILISEVDFAPEKADPVAEALLLHQRRLKVKFISHFDLVEILRCHLNTRDVLYKDESLAASSDQTNHPFFCVAYVHQTICPHDVSFKALRWMCASGFPRDSRCK